MAELLKNVYSPEYMQSLAVAVRANDESFDIRRFKERVFLKDWSSLELKQRMTRICEALDAELGHSFLENINILKKACKTMGPGQFEKMFFPEYVEKYGQDRKNRTTALKALLFFTQDSSSEFAVRPFIVKDPKYMISWMEKNSRHKNYHVRRLASEGVRPRLPWASALTFLKKEPGPILPILENLKNDPELYVRRSVANCLNDISKDHPDVTLRVLRKWNQNSTEKIQWITRHALRGLIKQGHPKALSLVGFKKTKGLRLGSLKIEPRIVKIGQSVHFSFSLTNAAKKTQNLMIDYVVHFVKKDGSTREKVFKLKQVELSPSEKINIEKRHSFKVISTRVYYPGKHHIEIQINGERFGLATFQLKR